MKLYVVVDTKGGGRILAVVDSKKWADKLMTLSPLYYKTHSVELNRMNPECLDWADSHEQALRLRNLLRHELKV